MSLETKENKFGLSDQEVEDINELGGMIQLMLKTDLNTDGCESDIKTFLEMATIAKTDFQQLDVYMQKEIDYYSSTILSELSNIAKYQRSNFFRCYSKSTYNYIKRYYPELLKPEMSFNHNDHHYLEAGRKIRELNPGTYYYFYRTDTDFKTKLELFTKYTSVHYLMFTTDAFENVDEVPKDVIRQVSIHQDSMHNWDIKKYPALKSIIEHNDFKHHFVGDAIIHDNVETFEYLVSLENLDLDQFILKYKFRFQKLQVNIKNFLGEHANLILEFNKRTYGSMNKELFKVTMNQ